MLKFILLHSCVLFNTPYTMDDQNETSQKKKNETFNYMHNKKTCHIQKDVKYSCSANGTLNFRKKKKKNSRHNGNKMH